MDLMREIVSPVRESVTSDRNATANIKRKVTTESLCLTGRKLTRDTLLA